jgi:tetratricopeptide (TPR) repeat protein
VTHPTGDPLIGRTVAQYEIVSRLGGGGMGVVYRAHDRKLGRTVAVKFLPPQWSHDEAAKQRFIREAQAASATHHPNICTIHDIETADDGQLFIVMAHYEGPTLKERLRHGPLPIEEALDIATQLADGLAKAHAQGVVHRDIKPGNLILTEDGVRIVDFGLATFADALQLTTDGSTLGTAAYMSPEQSRGEEADARTDVWAAGVVLYEMLAGHVPFRGSHAEAIAYAVRNDPPPTLRTVRPEIPEDVEQLVFRALHKEAAIRFQSGRELARALRQARGLTVPQDLRTQVVVPPPVATRGARRRARWAVAAAVTVAAVVIGAPAWLLAPIERRNVTVMPVVNATGFDDLDGVVLGLQEELAAALRTAPGVRLMTPERVRGVVRARRRSGDATGPETLRALAALPGAEIVLRPTLYRDDSEWRARLEVWRAGATDATLEATPVTSALERQIAYALTQALADHARDYLVRSGPLRGRVLDALRRMVRARPAGARRFRSADVLVSFEAGLDAHDRFEYASALAAFSEGVRQDPSNPLLHAWRSRTLLVMRRPGDSLEAAAVADRVLPDVLDQIALHDRLFIEAVVAEARGNVEAADAAHRAWIAEDPRSVTPLFEWAAYLDRRDRQQEAIRAYQAVLDLDPGFAWAHLGLCRVYGPARANDAVLAQEHARMAGDAFAAAGSREGEAQAAMCRVEGLRIGDAKAQAEATVVAARAGALLQALDAPYQSAWAEYYKALAAYWVQDFLGAIRASESALDLARRAGNEDVRPTILQTLGAAHSRLGHRALHIEHTRASAEIFAARGENERAAPIQANAGAALIDFGDDPETGFRLVDNALRVNQQVGNDNGEVFALQVIAAYHRYTGQQARAEQLLSQAIATSERAGLRQFLWSLRLDQSRSRYELADYVAARDIVNAGIGATTGRLRVQADVWLSQILMRMGDVPGARALLSAAGRYQQQEDVTTPMLIRTALGELEYESGNFPAAREHFRAAASAWRDELPHQRSVEALAYAGFLDVVLGRPGPGAAALERACARAQVTQRVNLVTRCAVFRARIALRAGRAREALEALRGAPQDTEQRTINPELRAHVRYWTGRALQARGDAAGAARELAEARRIIDVIRRRLPTETADAFGARVDVREVLR